MKLFKYILFFFLPIWAFAQKPNYEFRAFFSPVYYNLETGMESEYKFSYLFGVGALKNISKSTALNVDISLSKRNYNQYDNTPNPLNWSTKEYQDSYTYIDISTKMSFTVINKNVKLTINPGFVWSIEVNKERISIDYGNNATKGFWYKCDFTENPYYAYLGLGIKKNISNNVGLGLEPFFRYKLNQESVYSGKCPRDEGRFSYGISLIVVYFKGKK